MVLRAVVIALFAGICAAFPTVSAGAVPTVTASPEVIVGGISVSGLTLEQATARLQRRLEPALMRRVVVRIAGHRELLPAEQAGVKFDAGATARRALEVPAAQGSSSLSRGAASVPVIVDPVVRHSRLAVRAFAAKVSARVGRPPRNARVSFGIRRQHVKPARVGLSVDSATLAASIDRVLDSPTGSRLVAQKPRKTSPRRSTIDLRRRFGTIVTVDRATVTLRLFKHLRWAKSYKVAVGQPAYPTPTGRFRVQNKQVNPTWSVPRSPWAGELAGSVIPGGSAANPLKARWIGISGSVGIHGTGEDWSIGSAASHGCIRMHVWDVVKLYPRVPVGSRVFIR